VLRRAELTAEDFVESLRANSAKTAEQYELTLYKYAKTISTTPDEVAAKIKNRELDLIEFLRGLTTWSRKQNHKSITTLLYLTGWRQFLIYEGIKVDRDEVRARVRPPKRVKTFGGRPFTDEEIRKILRVAGFRYRAIFLTALTSGLRAGELGALQVKDLDLDASPATVQVAAATSKSRESRITYVSDEAANLLKELVKGRAAEEYVFNNNGPLTTDSITSATTRILTRAKIRNVNGKISFHSCRKWFTTHMVEKGVPLPVVELMCGRTIGVTQSYLKPEESKIKEYYTNAMQRTVLSETQINATGRIQALEEENKELKERLSQLESGKVKRKQEEEIKKMQERLAKLEAVYSERLKIKEH